MRWWNSYRLRAALQQHDSPRVRQLLSAGTDPSVALCEAAEKGDVDTMELLLDAGAPVNLQHRDWTPLMWAAMSGRAEVVKLLLSRGADVNERGADLRIPLLLACGGVDDGTKLGIVELLVNAGADVNARLGTGETALHAAHYHALDGKHPGPAYAPITKLLLQHGANPNVDDEKGGTPLMLACLAGDAQAVQYLLESGADPNASTPSGGRALSIHLSVRKHDQAIISALLRHGADVNAADARGLTPLAFAVLQDDAPTVRLLLEAGANPRMSFPNGLTILELAQNEDRKLRHGQSGEVTALLIATQGDEANRS